MTTRTKAILGLSAVFLLGALIGASLLGLYVTAQVTERESLRDPARFRDFFADRLDLDDAQRDSIDDELAQTYDDLLDVRENVDEEYRIIFDSLDRRIAPLLNREQRHRLQEQRLRFLPRHRHAAVQRATVRRQIADRHVAKTLGDSAIAGGAPSTNMSEPAATPLTDDDRSTSSGMVDAADGDGRENLGAASSTNGDSADATEANAPKLIELMARRLALTSEQTTSLEEIFRNGMKRGKKIRREFADRPDVMRRRLMTNRMMIDRQIRDILTEEQRVIYASEKDRLLKKMNK